jgi:rhombotail lipoprotein
MSASKFLIVLFTAVLTAGCTFGGSQNERPAQTYPTFIMSLYDDTKPRPSTPPTAPMRVAIAQVGELVPPQAMLDHLRQNKSMFQRVEGIPAVFDDFSQSGALPTTPKQITRDRVARLQRMTQDLGLDYLFIYGDTVSNYTRENPLQILDLTIVGAFVIPSREVRATGKAAGALIDARTGSVLFIASADTEQTKMATGTNQEGETAKVVQNARESLTLRLADQLVARTQEVSLTGPMPLGN